MAHLIWLGPAILRLVHAMLDAEISMLAPVPRVTAGALRRSGPHSSRPTLNQPSLCTRPLRRLGWHLAPLTQVRRFTVRVDIPSRES